MSLSTEQKKELISEYQTSQLDSASPQVQVALITKRLNYLNQHFKENPKDHHSRRGLMGLVGRRRKLLNYLSKNNNSEYQTLISKLNIRK